MSRSIGLFAFVAFAAGLLITWHGLADPPASVPGLQKPGSNANGQGDVPSLKKLTPAEEPLPNELPQARPEDNKPLPPLEKFKQLLPKDGPPSQPLKTSKKDAEDPREIIARVAKNMETSEDHLKTGKTDKDTQSIQKKIIEDLEKLINQQQKNQQSKDKSQNQKNSSSQDQKNKDNTKPDNKQTKPNPADKEPIQSTQQGKEPKDKTGKAELKNGSNADKSADLTVSNLVKDIWGHLPKNKRQEMDAYSHEKFMPQYEQLLRQYYQNIAAQKKNKGGN